MFKQRFLQADSDFPVFLPKHPFSTNTVNPVSLYSYQSKIGMDFSIFYQIDIKYNWTALLICQDKLL